jgi:uncharacterized membrane protein YkoI
MQRTAKILSALTLIAALGTGAAIASGKTGNNKLPDEVKSASIKVPENTESQSDFVKLAHVSQQEAEAAALALQPGRVVKAKLDDEEGYLVWQIDVKHAKGTTEIAVDAGNSKVLAAEPEENDGNEHEGNEGHEGHHTHG